MHQSVPQHSKNKKAVRKISVREGVLNAVINFFGFYNVPVILF